MLNLKNIKLFSPILEEEKERYEGCTFIKPKKYMKIMRIKTQQMPCGLSQIYFTPPPLVEPE